MGLFSRKKVAQWLAVSPARVSQMATSGAMIAPIEDEDGTERGWPSTYVEEVAALRQGRQTSRSIYGYPSQATPPVRVGDTVASGADGYRTAFIQLLEVDAGCIGLVTLLRPTIEQVSPFMDSLGGRPDTFYTYGDDLIPVIQSASENLGVDLYDIAWIQLGRLDATEVVVVSEPLRPDPHFRQRESLAGRGRRETASAERIPWATLHAKLGAPVPILDVPTVVAVDEWQRAGRTLASVVFNVDGNFNRATSAVLLAHLASQDTDSLGRQRQSERSNALRLALSRIERNVSWDRSGAQVDLYLAGLEPDHLELLTHTIHPRYGHLREELLSDLMEDVAASPAALQEAVDVLGRINYENYGPFGDTPTPSLAFALDQGVSALVGWLHDEEILVHNEPRPAVFYQLRSFELAQRFTSRWDEYAETLTPTIDLDSPDARVLVSKLSEPSTYEKRAAPSQIMVDEDGNYVLKQHVTRHGDDRITRVTIVVPIARLARRSLDHLKDFDEIVVEPNTQDGPVLLTVGGKLHVMPFGSPYPGAFTHGYTGHGPGNLAMALVKFLEWVEGATMSDDGVRRVKGIVATADQGRELRISRGQVFMPGMFLPPESSR